MAGLIAHVLEQTERACDIQRALTAIPALGPENGGQGEAAKASLVENLLRGYGIMNISHFDSPDNRVPCGYRPNIVARIDGKTSHNLWLFGHLDVVPPGEGWKTDPWTLHREGDLIYGRGVEDNQQAVSSMLVLAQALTDLRIIPDIGLGLVFMADEECGSHHGLGHILATAGDMFSSDDLYVVPDGGFPDAASIEIAEKAQLWLKFIVNGAQCHASMPQNGVNALVAASQLICCLADLRFPQVNELFQPPGSTFSPTRHDGNGDAINILPGRDVFYVDCRLLPELSPTVALEAIEAIAREVDASSGSKTKITIVQEQAASSTSPDSLVVQSLTSAIEAIYGVKASPCGIGGATVAALLRQAGLPAAVWSCIQNACHQPNEFASLSATCRDAAVFAHMLMNCNTYV